MGGWDGVRLQRDGLLNSLRSVINKQSGEIRVVAVASGHGKGSAPLMRKRLWKYPKLLEKGSNFKSYATPTCSGTIGKMFI